MTFRGSIPVMLGPSNRLIRKDARECLFTQSPVHNIYAPFGCAYAIHALQLQRAERK